MSGPTSGQNRAEAREARRQELTQKSKRQLIAIHRAGAGTLMTIAQLSRWTYEELEAAILEAEYGPLPMVELDIPEVTQAPLDQR